MIQDIIHLGKTYKFSRFTDAQLFCMRQRLIEDKEKKEKETELTLLPEEVIDLLKNYNIILDYDTKEITKRYDPNYRVIRTNAKCHIYSTGIVTNVNEVNCVSIYVKGIMLHTGFHIPLFDFKNEFNKFMAEYESLDVVGDLQLRMF